MAHSLELSERGSLSEKYYDFAIRWIVQLHNLIYWEKVGEGCSMCDANCKLGNQMPKLETWIDCIYYKDLFDFFFCNT